MSIEDGYRLFVAVTRSRGEAGAYLSDCFVYEVSDRGDPVAIVNMPRVILGSQFKVTENAVIWRCEQGGVAKIEATRQTEGFGMGPGGTDCVGRLVWYHEPSGIDRVLESRKAWLRTGIAGDPAAFAENSLFRLPEGGFLTARNEKVFHFPMEIMALSTGIRSHMTLKVPFNGSVKMPTSYPSSDGRVEAYGPHALAITDIAVDGLDLNVSLSGEGGWSAMVTFEGLTGGP